MTITITDCTKHSTIAYAEITDVYGNTVYCNGYGVYDVPSGNAGNLLNTSISVEAANYNPGNFTITSDGGNTFCLSATPPQQPTSGGIYSII